MRMPLCVCEHRGVGVTHITFLGSPPLSWLELGRRWSVAMWGNGTKINCVCLLLRNASAGALKSAAACDQWSMLCFARSFSKEPFINPASLWEYISHSTAGPVNSCLIKLEMHLWYVISLIEAAGGRSRDACLVAAELTGASSLLETATIHSQSFQPRWFISSHELKRKQSSNHL